MKLRRSFDILPPVMAAGTLAFLACAGSPPASAQPLVHEPQKNLESVLKNAPVLNVEELMAGPQSVWDQHMFWVPNNDGRTWDVLFFYSPKYMGPHEVFILDTGTGEVKRQRMEEGFMFHMIDNFMVGGKLYLKPHVQDRRGEAIWIYDPDKNEMTFGGRPMGRDMENFGGKWVVEDEIFYGVGRVGNQYAAYRLDPRTLKSEVFPGFGELHKSHDWTYTSLNKAGDWLYAKVGKAPWRLWGYNISTGEGKILIETEVFEGNHRSIHVRPLDEPGGFQVDVDRPKGKKEGVFSYWLRDGEVMEKTGDTPPWSDKALEWKPRLREASFPKPEMRRTPPSGDGRVNLQWRYGSEEKWWNATFEVKLHQQPLRRMATLPDGRIFGLGESYAAAVLYDPAKNERTQMGRTVSVYSMTQHEGLVYMSGYSGAVIWQYDPTRPWNVNLDTLDIGQGAEKGAEKAELELPESNPRQVAKLQDQTKMQNPWGGTVVGADGKVYASGWIIRVGNGGALGWWDPKTDESGGLTDPFSAYPIYWMCGVGDGTAENRYLAISTKTTKDDKDPTYQPDQGRVFIFDTQAGKIISDFLPTTKGFHGPVVDAGPGKVMGFARESEGNGLLWTADVVTGDLLWSRSIPAEPVTSFAAIRRNAGTILQKGPDGKIWTFLGNTLVRISPEDGEVESLGVLPSGDGGQLAFAKGEIHLAGSQNLRRIHLQK